MNIWKNLKAAVNAMATAQTNINGGTTPTQPDPFADPFVYAPYIAPQPSYYSNNQVTYAKARKIREDIQTGIRTIRKAKSWSQRDLAQASGYSQTTVHRIEKNKGASTASLIRMIAALDMELTITPPKS